MVDPASNNWTSGAPKWAAVVVLGAASVASVAWAIGREGSGRSIGPSRPVETVIPGASPANATAIPPAANAAPAITPGAPVPASTGSAPEKKPEPSPALSLRRLINVNTAGQGELELLPGIGPALAKRIIDFRATKGAFKRVDDLDAVKGIGPKILERIRGQVTVE